LWHDINVHPTQQAWQAGLTHVVDMTTSPKNGGKSASNSSVAHASDMFLGKMQLWRCCLLAIVQFTEIAISLL